MKWENALKTIIEVFPYHLPIAYFVIAPGPVRNLQCNYDTLRRPPLSCKWNEPEKVYAPIKSYHVNVIHESKIILQTELKEPHFEADSLLVQGGISIVSVRAMNHVEGMPSETRVNFINSGMSSLTSIHFMPHLSSHHICDCIFPPISHPP